MVHVQVQVPTADVQERMLQPVGWLLEDAVSYGRWEQIPIL